MNRFKPKLRGITDETKLKALEGQFDVRSFLDEIGREEAPLVIIYFMDYAGLWENNSPKAAVSTGPSIRQVTDMSSANAVPPKSALVIASVREQLRADLAKELVEDRAQYRSPSPVKPVATADSLVCVYQDTDYCSLLLQVHALDQLHEATTTALGESVHAHATGPVRSALSPSLPSTQTLQDKIASLVREEDVLAKTTMDIRDESALDVPPLLPPRPKTTASPSTVPDPRYASKPLPLSLSHPSQCLVPLCGSGRI